MKTHIVVKAGGHSIFEGTVDHFRDTFFDNADMETVCEWAEEQGYEVTYTASNKKYLVGGGY